MVTFSDTALCLPTVFAMVADPELSQVKAQTQKQEQIYGSQLMTQQERTEYHAKMSAVKTAEEREQIRKGTSRADRKSEPRRVV